MKVKYLVVGLVAVFVASLAWASEPVVCAFGVGTSTASQSHNVVCTSVLPDAGAGPAVVCYPDAGGTCTWGMGSTLLVQCDQDIYIDTTDGGTATSFDERVNYSADVSPRAFYLDAKDQNVSILAVSSHTTCKVQTTKRPKPWQVGR